MRRANLMWERLGSSDVLGPTQQYREIRQQMLAAERNKVLEMRDHGLVDHEVIDNILYHEASRVSCRSYAGANSRLRLA